MLNPLFVACSRSRTDRACRILTGGTVPPWAMVWAGVLLVGPLWATTLSFVGPPSFIASLGGFLLVQLLLVATITDLRHRRIPNWLTYSTLLAGGVLNLIGTHVMSVERAFPVQDLWTISAEDFPDITRSESFARLGSLGVQRSLTGAVSCFVIMLGVYSLCGTGAGDVKLAAATGSLVGAACGIKILVVCHVFAGATMVALLIWKIGCWRSTLLLSRGIGSLLFPSHVLPPAGQQAWRLRMPVPLAVFFAIATIVVLFNELN